MVLLSIIAWLVSSFLNGLFFTAVLLFLFYYFYYKDLPIRPTPSNPQFESYEFSPVIFLKWKDDSFFNIDSSSIRFNLKLLKEKIEKNKEGLDGKCDGVIALNMMFQFLFQELKDTKLVRRYIIKKMSAEFKELLTTKTAGKLIQRLTVNFILLLTILFFSSSKI